MQRRRNVPLALPLKRRFEQSHLPLVLVADRRVGPWQPLSADVTANGGHATFKTPHFSYFRVVAVDLKEICRAARETFDGATYATAEAKQPRCEDESGARSEGFKIESKGPDTLKWCFGREAGRRVIRITNARRSATRA